MQDLCALDPNQTSLATKLWEQHIRSICLHNLADFIKSVEYYTINLVRRYHYILDVAFGVQDQLVKFLFCMVDAILIFPSDVHFIFASSVRSLGRVPIDAGEGRWKVYRGIGGSFDKADILAGSATYDCVQGQLELQHIEGPVQLLRSQQVSPFQAVVELTTLSIMMSTLVFACSELSGSP